jgi:sulfotransferase
MRTIYFIGGLPRSGSTLLCNILAQNPELYVTKSTSGFVEVLIGTRNRWDKILEHKAEGINYDQLKNVLGGIYNTYHLTDKNLIVDKSRGWLAHIETLQFVTGHKPKIIAPVRNITQILSSFEKLWRNNSSHTQWGFADEDYALSQTIEGRCEIWANRNNVVGIAYNRIKDAISRGYKNDLLFVEFDDLTTKPEEILKKIYAYIDQPYFPHYFTNIKQVTEEDDIGVHRIENLHTIRPDIKPLKDDSKEILGDFLFEKYSNLEIWR